MNDASIIISWQKLKENCSFCGFELAILKATNQDNSPYKIQIWRKCYNPFYFDTVAEAHAFIQGYRFKGRLNESS